MTRLAKRYPLKDSDVDRAVSEVARAHDDVARDPVLSRRVITVTLPNATTVKTQHKLGRKYEHYTLSAPRGASATGRIVDVEPTDGSDDIWLQANGYGATVTVRMMVW